jgi:hypothetical protein
MPEAVCEFRAYVRGGAERQEVYYFVVCEVVGVSRERFHQGERLRGARSDQDAPPGSNQRNGVSRGADF